MAFETKDISEIKVGTYIVEIAEQQGKNKLVASGWVGSQKVVEKFRKKGITKVVVDPAKFHHPEHKLIQKQAFFQEDVKKARETFSKSKAISKKLFEDALNGKNLEMEPLKNVTEEAMDSVFENPDSLACVINIRNKDEYLLEHSISVSVLITIFARHLGIPKDIVHELAIGAFLHDVGKIKVPDEILNKPGRLTEEEFEVIKTHVIHSNEIIMDTADVPALSLEVAAQHHEKLNGKGYPCGIGGDDITKFGRMIAICDIFDALTANRCYKDGLPQVKSFVILREMAKNGELDAALVDEFIRCMGVYPVGSLVVLSSNHLAVVEGRNPKDPIKPKVNVFYDLNGLDFESSTHKDLAKDVDDQIVKCVKADEFDLNMGEIMDYLQQQG